MTWLPLHPCAGKPPGRLPFAGGGWTIWYGSEQDRGGRPRCAVIALLPLEGAIAR